MTVREPGRMDNPYTTWSPIVERPPLRWPGGAPLAVCVIVTLETMEWHPSPTVVVPPSATGYGPYPRAFQVSRVAAHEYGNRVGFFRVADLLDRHGIRATAAVDAQLARSTPYLLDRCQERDWEIIGHGVAFNRMITSQLGRDAERAEIAEALDALEAATGRRPAGWMGADYGESVDTVALLAEQGVRYVCDWANDEQPYPLRVPAGEIHALPIAVDLDPVFAHKTRHVPIDRWARMVREAAAQLRADGAASGRVLVLHLPPYLMGQPFRVRHLDAALAALADGDTWLATGSEIVDWCAHGEQTA